MTVLSKITVAAAVIVLIGLALPSDSLAQMGRNARGCPLIDFMEKIELTDDQQAKVDPIVKDHCDQMSALRDKFRGQGRDAMDQAREEMDKIKADTDKKLAEILTSDQLDELKKLEDEQRSERRNNRPGRGSNQRRP